MANCLWTVLFERGHLFPGEEQKEQNSLWRTQARLSCHSRFGARICRPLRLARFIDEDGF
jgi:hypothetical protein